MERLLGTSTARSADAGFRPNRTGRHTLQDEEAFTRSQALLLMNAQQTRDQRATRLYLDQLFLIPTNATTLPDRRSHIICGPITL